MFSKCKEKWDLKSSRCKVRKRQQIGLKQKSPIIERVGRALGHERKNISRKSTSELPEQEKACFEWRHVWVKMWCTLITFKFECFHSLFNQQKQRSGLPFSCVCVCLFPNPRSQYFFVILSVRELVVQGNALVWSCCSFMFVTGKWEETHSVRLQCVLCFQLSKEEMGASYSNLNTLGQ